MKSKVDTLTSMQESLIAPCGMNCSLCIAYQFRVFDINRHGFHRRSCPACMPRGEHCTHMSDACGKLAKGEVRFCFTCERYPCKRLKQLDLRYRKKYHMSMIENLDFIQRHGMDTFLAKETAKWTCPKCGEVLCCHNGLCLNCDLETLIQNRKYRWNETDDTENK